MFDYDDMPKIGMQGFTWFMAMSSVALCLECPEIQSARLSNTLEENTVKVITIINCSMRILF